MPHEATRFQGHPELDIPDYSTLHSVLHAHVAQAETSVSVLELQRSDHDSIRQRLHKDLRHGELVDYLEESDRRTGLPCPALRVLFVNDEALNPEDPLLGASVGPTRVALNPMTIDCLVRILGVSPIFFSTITTIPWLLDTGNALFKTFDADGQSLPRITSVQGFFRFSDRGRPSHVWFRHDTTDKSTTYIIQGCPQRVTSIVMQWAEDDILRVHLLRPFALESLLIDEVTWMWSKAVVDNAKRLLEYEHFTKEESGERIDTAVHALHTLSQHFHILQEELSGMVEQLDYLINVHNLVFSSQRSSQWSAGESQTSVVDSLHFLRSRTHNWQRWVSNWKERTNIRIHLFFNLATQRDNETNVNIGHFTSEIATETHKDSSSMMTIAVLTLVFLPGTFIAGVFSMPMVEQTLSDPRAGWRLYMAITIPLTVFVIFAWNVWRLSWNTRQARQHLSTSKPAPEAPPLDPPLFTPREGGRVGRDSNPNMAKRGPNHPSGFDSSPFHFERNGQYDLRNVRIHIPPRSPPSPSSTTSFSRALSTALSQIGSPTTDSPPTGTRLRRRSALRQGTISLKQPLPDRPRDFGGDRMNSHSPIVTSPRSRPTYTAANPFPSVTSANSLIPLGAGPNTSGRSVMDPNSPPFEGYGMWAPDPLEEPPEHSSRRRSTSVPLRASRPSSTIRSFLSGGRKSPGSAISSRRSSAVLGSSPFPNSRTIHGASPKRSRSRSAGSVHFLARSPHSIFRRSSLDLGQEFASLASEYSGRGRSPTRSLRYRSAVDESSEHMRLLGDGHSRASASPGHGPTPLIPLQQFPSFSSVFPSESRAASVLSDYGAPTPDWESSTNRAHSKPLIDSHPTDEQLVNSMEEYMTTQDLMVVTKRMAREAIAVKFPNTDLSGKKDLLNQAIDNFVRNMVEEPGLRT